MRRVERRKYPRYNLECPVECLIKTGTTHITTLNISLGGLKLLVPEKPDIGSMLFLIISVSPQVSQQDFFYIKAKAKVIWSGDKDAQGRYPAGVEFIDIAKDDLGKIRDIIDKISPENYKGT